MFFIYLFTLYTYILYIFPGLFLSINFKRFFLAFLCTALFINPVQPNQTPFHPRAWPSHVLNLKASLCSMIFPSFILIKALILFVTLFPVFEKVYLAIHLQVAYSSSINSISEYVSEKSFAFLHSISHMNLTSADFNV